MRFLAGASESSTLENTNICLIKYTKANQTCIMVCMSAVMEHPLGKQYVFYLQVSFTQKSRKFIKYLSPVSYVNGMVIIYSPGGQNNLTLKLY